MRPERTGWPRREHYIDIAWALFAFANLTAISLFPTWETVPFHFIWVSLTLLYGFRVWTLSPTLWTLAAVIGSTGLLIGLDIARGDQPLDEITEVPLMSAMFLAMVWHARRRVAAVEEARAASEANLRLVDREHRFLQDASHELRTPITVALGHAELIRRHSTDRLVVEDVDVVVDELLRLRRLADRLLLLAAAEHPDFLHTAPIDVEPLVIETVRRWAPTPRRWALGQIQEATVQGDRDRLALALDALIENAVNHTGTGDTIELSVEREDHAVMVRIRDSGTGIAPVDLERIFERFARPDAGRSRDRGGIGLGLSIVRAVAAAHGGSVRVSSSLGQGSEFEIRLPALPEAGADRPEVIRPPAPGAHYTSPKP